MGLRDKINESRMLGLSMILVLLAVAITVLARQFRPAAIPEASVYFYDLGSRKLFVGKMNQVPPIAAPSKQGEAVVAHAYACGSCGNVDDLKVLYLEKYTPEAKAAMERNGPAANAAGLKGWLVASGSEPAKWVPGSSAAGAAIASGAMPACPPPAQAVICDPAAK